VVLWGSWLLVLAAFFSAGGYPNSYYVAALSPATGALCGAGVALAQRARRRMAASAGLAAAMLCSVGYGIYLLNGGTTVPGWLLPVAGVTAALGALALLTAHGRRILRSSMGGVIVTMACALVLPGVASVLMVTRGLGPFAAPYQPASATVSRAAARRSRLLHAQVMEELDSTYATPITLVTDSSILAAPFILATGKEVLPIGGFQGGIPAPSLAELRRRMAAEEVRAFIVPTVSDDPRITWIHSHCKTESPAGARNAEATALYDCASS
jgi:4-amino-4-deoxy-L-arabinose transferase-like glycosyltransferase